MKLIKNSLKAVLLLFVIFTSLSMYSQNQTKENKMFVRVFDFEGKKIGKGYIVVANDSTLELSRSNESKTISLKNINYIKTKRSAGNNVLVGSIAGATTLGILGAATADPDAWIFVYTAAEGALGFGLIGAVGGGAIGGITSVFKNAKTFSIDGNNEKWKRFRELYAN
jgi:hypothetical protein